MKLWDKKGTTVDDLVASFTVGNDRLYDIKLARYDILGSMGHVKMLESINILNKKELDEIEEVLLELLKEVDEGTFVIESHFEDIHSKIEYVLTHRLGEVGKKIHTGRSRNDQILVDLCMYFKDEILEIKDDTKSLFDTLLRLSEEHKADLMPGYTHMQIAMPSSFGLWFGGYAETLIDDVTLLGTVYDLADQNPLGSAAGYGSSFPLDRELTTKQLNFSQLKVNSIAAQMMRGRLEKYIAFAIASLAGSLGKLAMDICMYAGQDFGFLSFPDKLTTGSSIMPHKKNPDVWELIRAKSNRLQSLPMEVTVSTNSLGTGYHRDYQLLKEMIFPAIESIKTCLQLTDFMLSQIRIRENILADLKYDLVFSVEAVNHLILTEGMSFRDAYKHIGEEIASGSFKANRNLNHTHLGSIGNLGNVQISEKMNKALTSFTRQ